jgi:hypothetical protein
MTVGGRGVHVSDSAEAAPRGDNAAMIGALGRNLKALAES